MPLSSGEREFETLAGQLQALEDEIAAARRASSDAPARQASARRAPRDRAPALRGDRVALADGGQIVIRPVEPQDVDELASGFERLGALSRFRLFGELGARLTRHELAELTEVDHHASEMLVALDAATGEGVGIARYDCVSSDPGRADVTCAVVDAWQHRGVGSALAERLAARARAAGIDRCTAEVVLGNAPARRLLAHAADEVDERRDGGTIDITAQARSVVSRREPAPPPGWRAGPPLVRSWHHSTEAIAMFDKTVVGVDDRQGGRDALALAVTLTAIEGGELLAVRAYPHEARPSRATVGGFDEDMRADASSELDRIVAESGATARRIVFGDTSPARALHRVAEDEDADLLVVGSTHRGQIGRVLAGGVTAGVLHHAPCPVAVAPLDYATRAAQPAVIGVGFDGGIEAQHALRLAGDLATVCGARVRVLSAVATPVMATSPATYESEWLAEAREKSGAEAEQAISTLEGMGLEASGDGVVGLAVDELAELSHEVDLLVVGSRGWGPVRRLLLGSTSERLVREAACPVIAVPRPGGEG
jgi:nucleotide-binding universal stress UspA family protein